MSSYRGLLAKWHALRRERIAAGLCEYCAEPSHEWFWCDDQIEQRVSFVFGNLACSTNHQQERELVRAAVMSQVAHLRGSTQ